MITRFFDDLLTDVKNFSHTKRDTFRQIPFKFQLNPSSRLGGVVISRYFDFGNGLTYSLIDGQGVFKG